MKSPICVCFLLVVFSSATFAQPFVQQGGILNAASYAIRGLPNHGIAQGSMFIVFGAGLGPATLRLADSLPYPAQLAGTSIRVTAGNVTRDAIMVYTSDRQAAGILPSSTPVGDGTLTVTYDGRTSAPVTIPIVRSGLGVFTRNQAGSGPAIVQNFNSSTDQPVNALTEVARPGQVMILWGTGLGPVDFDDAIAPLPRNLDVDVEVLVGGRRANVLYKGRSPQFPGIDQINFQLPTDVPNGCYVPLVVRAGGMGSNFTTIAVSSQGRVCSDVAGIAAADLQRAQSTGELTLGSIFLERFVAKGQGAVDRAFAEFDRYDYPLLLKTLGIGNQMRWLEVGIPPLGSCNVLTGRSDYGGPLDTPLDPNFPLGIDAGPNLNLAGPLGLKQIKKRTGATNLYGGYIGGTIPGFANFGAEFLIPGTYQVENGSGTAALGPFLATLTLPTPPEWTNQDSISSVPRLQDLVVTWSGGDSVNEYVFVLGVSNDVAKGISGGFLCTERVSAGQFTVPTIVLSALPPSGMNANKMTGYLEVGSSPIQERTRFQAPGLDAAYFGYVISYWKMLSYE